MRRTFLYALLGIALPFAAAACGSAPPPPPAEPAPPPPPPPPKLHMTSELGEIDEAATKRTFDHANAAMMRCYTTGLAHLEYMAGDIKFYIRVKPDGHLRWAVVEQSTIGDRKTESCMVEVLSTTQWPLPEGGEAEVHHGMGFDPPGGVRAPTDWSSDRIAAALAKHGDDIAACRKHTSGKVDVTAYVGPDHGAGHVLSAGAAAPNVDVASDEDCVLGVVRAMKLPSPGSYPAKVSFSL